MNAFSDLAAQDAAHRAFVGHDRRDRPPDRAMPADVRESPRSARAAPPFAFVAVGDLEIRAPEYLVAGLIETDSLGLLFGGPGCCKTFVAVDLALCVASGADFHGRAVKQGLVLFIAGEGHNGLARRFAAWSRNRSVSLKGLPLFKSERAAQFLDGASATAVADAADALAKDHGEPALIIVDTLARNFGAGDENNTQDMSHFVAAMDDLKSRYPGCVVLIVHHSGHAETGRARGAIALKAALDVEYRVEKEDSRVRVINTKMKDAEPPRDLSFSLETVVLPDGATSAVLQSAGTSERREKRTPAQALALSTYEMAANQHGVWTGNAFRGVHLEHWREAFYVKHTGDNAATKRKAFQRVRADLTTSGAMVVTDDIYLVTDAAVQTAIMGGPRPAQEASGTSGTCRDMAENVPVREPKTAGHAGHTPKGCPVSRSDLRSEGPKPAGKAECPDVPLSLAPESRRDTRQAQGTARTRPTVPPSWPVALSPPVADPPVPPTRATTQPDPDAFDPELWR